MKKALLILLPLILLAPVLFFRTMQPQPVPSNKGTETSSQAPESNGQDEMVRSIILPHFVPQFAPGPGREQFLTACVSCHSPRYVSMQPRFPRKVWDAEVHKMIKVFGAPVSEQQAGPIVEYLMSIKGVE